MSSPTPSSSGSAKLRRTILACTNCRKRKIRCITSEQPPTNPCTRCKNKNLSCQYVSADTDTREVSPASSPSPDSDSGEVSAPAAAERSYNNRNRRPSPGTLSVPSFQGWSSLSPARAISPSPPSRHSQRPLSSLYDMQAMHARQYLDARTAAAAAQSHSPMPGTQPQPNYGADPAQLHNDMMLDFWLGDGHSNPWPNNNAGPSSSYESGPWPGNNGTRHGGGGGGFYPYPQ